MAYNLNRAASLYALKTAASKLLSLINAKADKEHTHGWGSITSKPALMEAGDYSAETIEALLAKVQGTSPRMGSAYFTKDTHVAIGWYNFIYTPHRDGIGGDNPDYGTLMIFPLNFSGSSYIIRAEENAAVAEVRKIYTSSDKPGKADVGLGNVDNTADANKSVKYATRAGSAAKVNGHTVNSDVPPGAKFTDTNTTYSAFKAATSSAAGGAGLVPAPAAGAQAKYLRGDGTWQTPPDTNTTYGAMTGASTSAAGKAGLVPAPAAGAATRYLRSDGTWQVPPDTNTNTWRGVQNNLTSTATDQSLSAAMGKKLQDEKAAKTTQVALSIPASGWASDGLSGCPYYRDFAVSGLTASDIVGLVVDPASAAVAHTAGLVCTESRAGVLRLRAMRIPAAAISASYYIIH